MQIAYRLYHNRYPVDGRCMLGRSSTDAPAISRDFTGDGKAAPAASQPFKETEAC